MKKKSRELKHRLALYVPNVDSVYQFDDGVAIPITQVEERGHKQFNGGLFTLDKRNKLCAKLGEYRSNPSAYDEHSHKSGFRPHFAIIPKDPEFGPRNDTPEGEEHLLAAYFLRNYWLDEDFIPKNMKSKAYPGQSGKSQRRLDVWGTRDDVEYMIEVKVSSGLDFPKRNFLFKHIKPICGTTRKVMIADIGFGPTRKFLLGEQRRYLELDSQEERSLVANNIVCRLLNEMSDLFFTGNKDQIDMGGIW